MRLSLTDVQRIANDVAHQQHPGLDVVGVISREGSTSSAEVVFTLRNCDREPCRVVVDVSRQTSESECRRAVRSQLADQFGPRAA
jgi:hypothetical protein